MNEVITQAADSSAPDASSGPVESVAEVREVPTNDVAGAVGPASEAPLPEHANGSPVAAAGADGAVPGAAVSEEVSTTAAEFAGDGPVCNVPVLGNANSSTADVSGLDARVSETPVSPGIDFSGDAATVDEPVPDARVSDAVELSSEAAPESEEPVPDTSVSEDVGPSLDDAPEFDEPAGESGSNNVVDADDIAEVADSPSDAPASENVNSSTGNGAPLDDRISEAPLSEGVESASRDAAAEPVPDAVEMSSEAVSESEGPVPDNSVSEDVGLSSEDAPEFDEPVSGASVADDIDSDDPAEVADSVADAPASENADFSSDDDSEFDEPVGDASVPDDADSEPDAVRQQLVRQFETWLDRMDEGEPPPEGLPEELLADALETPEPADALGSDLYTVFAGLTKLSGEVGLQGRSFRQLADVLAPSMQVPGRLERLEAAQNAVARELARRAEPDEAELPASEDVLAVLFDLYDRLNRGLQNFDSSYEAVKSSIGGGGFLQRLLGNKANADQLAAPAAAMREGYRLTLSRLEAALLQWGIQRTGDVGEPFDPQRMAVIEVAAPTAQVPDGSVLEVYRSGYVVNGRVLATARVKVAKAGSSG